MCVCVCVCMCVMCVRARMCLCVCMCVCACVRLCMYMRVRQMCMAHYAPWIDGPRLKCAVHHSCTTAKVNVMVTVLTALMCAG